MMPKIGIIAITVVAFKIIYNLYYLLLTQRYYKEYVKFIKDSDSWFIKEHRQGIVRLFQKAGIKDTQQPIIQPSGYGMVATGNYSVFRNLSVIQEDVVAIVNGFFHEAIGIYKQRIFETINPIYWLELLFQLPKVIFKYLGISSSSFIVKFFQIIWWIVMAVSTLVGLFFNKEFALWLQKVI